MRGCQKTNPQRKGNNRKLYSLSLSVIFHVMLLAFLAAGGGTKIKFSKSVSEIESGSIVRTLLKTPPVSGRPKIKSVAEEGSAAESLERFAEREMPRANVPVFEPRVETVQDAAGEPIFEGEESVSAGKVSLFGSEDAGRRILYLVDSSGSMKGTFERVGKEVCESICKLEPDQYFSVWFFGGEGLVKFEDGKVKRASPAVKEKAYGFVGSVIPSGQTNAGEALQEAIENFREVEGEAVIYFLSDGFELGSEGGGQFAHKINNLVTRFRGRVKINCIGFWPREQDREVLEAIAEASGGRITVVETDGR